MAAVPPHLEAALAGRYQFERELGQGGMATVFLADDLRHHRPVAIKVLKPELTALLGTGRFLREIEIAARLQHPHIVPLLDSGAAGNLLYYVMPYVEGESLRQRLERERQLQVDDALQIAREVAGALDYAHRHGVVHRDIKPENILLGEGQVFVADFGIARAMAVAGGIQATPTGSVLGTASYMSPEQALASEHIDGRSDIYSLGCVLFELLAGQPPFTGATEESVFHQHLSVEPRPVTALRPAVSEAVSRVVRRALAKTPADRFATAAEFREALPGVGTETGAGTLPAAATTPARRVGVPRLAAGLGLFALAALGGALLLPRSRQFLLEGFATPPGPASLAVLYFDNFGPPGNDDYLAAGVTEEVTTSLSQIHGIRVTSRTAVDRYRGKVISPEQVRRDLKVSYLLEGSIRRGGDDLRVTAQLIRTNDGFHVWAGRYEGKVADIFAVQDTIAAKIAAALKIALAPEERARIARRWTEDAQAYAHYLTGREIYFDTGSRPDAATEARPWFEKALALDPDYAPAEAGLADVLVAEWNQGRRIPNQLTTAIQLAQRAQRLDPSLGVAWRAEARARVSMDQRRRARELLEHALDVSPNTSETCRSLADVYSSFGQRDRAEEMVRRGIAADPDLPNSYAEVGAYRWRGAYADADRIISAGLARMPDNPLLLVARAEGLEAQRRHQEALAILRHVLKLHPGYYRAMLQLATVSGAAHDRATADSTYQAMLALWPDVPEVVNEVAHNEVQRRRAGAAESLFRRALRLEPDFYPSRWSLARSDLDTGKHAEAEKAMLVLAQHWPNDAMVCEDIARCYFDLKRYDDAERWAKRSITIAPERLSAYDQLAWDYNAQGRFDDAVSSFRKEISLRPDAYPQYRALSLVLQNQGKFREAVEAAQRSVELRPDYYEGYLALGNAYASLQDRFQAAAAYEKAVAVDSTRAGAINNLATVYLTEERYEKALEMFRRVAVIDTTSYAPLENILYVTRVYVRDSMRVRMAAQACIDRAPGTIVAADGFQALGVLQGTQGHPEEAKDCYARGLSVIQKLKPEQLNWPDAQGIAGLLCAHSGDRAGARRHAEWLVKARGGSAEDLYSAATILAIAGDVDSAVDCFRRSVAAGFDDKGLATRDPDLDRIRGDPRFKELLASLR